MPKLGCLCGNTIADIQDSLPYKAAIVSDEVFYEFHDRIDKVIEELLNAIKNDKREEWIKSNFSVPPYPLDLDDAGMIADIFSRRYFDLKKDVFQCESCGRILIQTENTEKFESFIPENPNNWNMVLKKNK